VRNDQVVAKPSPMIFFEYCEGSCDCLKTAVEKSDVLALVDCRAASINRTSCTTWRTESSRSCRRVRTGGDCFCNNRSNDALSSGGRFAMEYKSLFGSTYLRIGNENVDDYKKIMIGLPDTFIYISGDLIPPSMYYFENRCL
jgi:hypothetical protein